MILNHVKETPVIVPVILSGGSGSRLWPLSRELFPKQLLPLVNRQTMLQNTVARLNGLKDVASPIVVCNEHHRFMVAQQLAEIGHHSGSILLEPVGRNTAPAVAVAAMQAMAEGYDPILLVLPADHVIQADDVLRAVIASGKSLAIEGKLITFGILPRGPETGYGYIKRGEAVIREDQLAAYAVARFEEKPCLETAKGFVASGAYYWNSGMFMFRASRYLAELETFAPEMIAFCRDALEEASRDADFIRLAREPFMACPSDSIDYAVMEKTTEAVVMPLDAGWNDVGCWSALWEVNSPDDAGNVTKGDVITLDVRNSYIHADDRLIAAVGFDNLVVVETADALLVAHKDHDQEVKEIVRMLKEQNREECFAHRKVYRPWGNYESIDKSDRFQVKRITVKPGGALSQQMHHHRAEHWIVVKGTARITKGSEILLLGENQSTYIPLGVSHRLENPGKIDLELIEVQSGSYLGEDDIVRFDDVYGRAAESSEKSGDCP